MILGRSPNLWLGFAQAVVGLGSLIAISLFHADPTVVATLGGGTTLLLGAVVSLVAGQPPTLSPGDTFHVQTEAGQPNYQTTVAQPPAQDPPPRPAA